jgi:hypothetical protein
LRANARSWGELGVRPVAHHQLVGLAAVDGQIDGVDHLVAVLLELRVAVLEPVELAGGALDVAIERGDPMDT